MGHYMDDEEIEKFARGVRAMHTVIVAQRVIFFIALVVGCIVAYFLGMHS